MSEQSLTKPSDIRKLIQKSLKELAKALPSHMSAERMVRIALTTLRLNPDLYKCTKESFLGALFQCAQLGLEPNIEGQAYIIPFNNRRKIDGEWKTQKEAQFQIGYKGYVELFYRHENSFSIYMEKVYENDFFKYELGTDPFITHKPAEKDKGEVIYFYAVAKLNNGATLFKVMTKEECMFHGKRYSKCYDKEKNKFIKDTPWDSNPDSMCLKTVLLQTMKLLPKSVEIQRALSMDETIKTKLNPDMAVMPDDTNWASEAIEELEEINNDLKDDDEIPEEEKKAIVEKEIKESERETKE